MNPIAPTGPSPVPIPAADEQVVRDLFPMVQVAADGSDALTTLTNRIVAAVQQYLIDVQATPETAAQITTPQPSGSPTVRANEHVLQGALLALTIDQLPHEERARLGRVARDAARRAGLDHLVIGRLTKAAA